MIYEVLKITHILSACVLFGTGFGTALYMLFVNLQSDLDLIARATRQVVFADWVFTGTSGVVQALTGFAMVALKGYALSHVWVLGAIVGYGIAGACWVPVVWLQLRCAQIAEQCLSARSPLTQQYRRYFRTWCLLGIPAFAALVVVFYLMTAGPLGGASLFGISLNAKVF